MAAAEPARNRTQTEINSILKSIQVKIKLNWNLKSIKININNHFFKAHLKLFLIESNLNWNLVKNPK